MSTPLDKRETEFEIEKGKPEIIPLLHPRWQEDVNFVSYQPPPVNKDDHGSYEEWLDRLKFIIEDLHWLLQLSHDKFWCQVVFDESLLGLIDTYLRYAPRSYDVIYELTEEGRERHNEVHRLIFMTCLRMATYKESKVI
ncbi:hypothetical protein KUTeg_006357 [Tegillarca granosa]|uniref:Uncharacterized protein n=1 Tax=Tegillarca granosa TaxID=220873 RepID=A0ABQ9FG84_TEGGR|nr:hypothetical protein KUTeg_006357 [Tegillarca granosa]